MVGDNNEIIILLYTKNQFIVQQNSVLHYKLDGEEIKLESCGVKASVIDFTLSRLSKGNPYLIYLCIYSFFEITIVKCFLYLV